MSLIAIACFECGSTENLHDHHVVPKSRGGTKTIPLCHQCHAMAHGKSGNFDIATLTSAALQHKKAQGEYTGGKLPFGRRLAADGVTLEECAEERAILDVINQLQREGLSLRKIAEELNKRGVSRRNGREWHHVAVSRVLAREQLEGK